jgi:hypothetical protein
MFGDKVVLYGGYARGSKGDPAEIYVIPCNNHAFIFLVKCSLVTALEALLKDQLDEQRKQVQPTSLSWLVNYGTSNSEHIYHCSFYFTLLIFESADCQSAVEKFQLQQQTGQSTLASLVNLINDSLQRPGTVLSQDLDLIDGISSLVRHEENRGSRGINFLISQQTS